MILALAAALVGALGYGAGSVLQSVGAARSTGPGVVGQPAFLVGLGCDGVAWLASLYAFRQMPVVAVQALLCGSVAVTVVLARVLLGARLRAVDTVAVAGVLLASVGVSAGFGAQPAGPSPRGLTAVAVVGVVAVAAALLAVYRSPHGWPAALVAGVAYSGAAVCARGLGPASRGWQLALAPAAWAVVGFAVAGTLGYARSLERWAVGPATALLWVTEVVLAGVGGIGFLGDRVRPGWAWPAAVSVGAAVLGCVVLATGPAAGRPAGRRPAGRHSALDQPR